MSDQQFYYYTLRYECSCLTLHRDLFVTISDETYPVWSGETETLPAVYRHGKHITHDGSKMVKEIIYGTECPCYEYTRSRVTVKINRLGMQWLGRSSQT